MRQNFRPYQQVVKVLKEDPGANRKAIVAQVKRAVVEADMHVHLEQCRSLVMQGQIARHAIWIVTYQIHESTYNVENILHFSQGHVISMRTHMCTIT